MGFAYHINYDSFLERYLSAADELVIEKSAKVIYLTKIEWRRRTARGLRLAMYSMHIHLIAKLYILPIFIK